MERASRISALVAKFRLNKNKKREDGRIQSKRVLAGFSAGKQATFPNAGRALERKSSAQVAKRDPVSFRTSEKTPVSARSGCSAQRKSPERTGRTKQRPDQRDIRQRQIEMIRSSFRTPKKTEAGTSPTMMDSECSSTSGESWSASSDESQANIVKTRRKIGIFDWISPFTASPKDSTLERPNHRGRQITKRSPSASRPRSRSRKRQVHWAVLDSNPVSPTQKHERPRSPWKFKQNHSAPSSPSSGILRKGRYAVSSSSKPFGASLSSPTLLESLQRRRANPKQIAICRSHSKGTYRDGLSIQHSASNRSQRAKARFDKASAAIKRSPRHPPASEVSSAPSMPATRNLRSTDFQDFNKIEPSDLRKPMNAPSPERRPAPGRRVADKKPSSPTKCAQAVNTYASEKRGELKETGKDFRVWSPSASNNLARDETERQLINNLGLATPKGRKMKLGRKDVKRRRMSLGDLCIEEPTTEDKPTSSPRCLHCSFATDDTLSPSGFLLEQSAQRLLKRQERQAAVMIQAFLRGSILRRRKSKVVSAIRIQAFVRGGMLRLKFRVALLDHQIAEAKKRIELSKTKKMEAKKAEMTSDIDRLEKEDVMIQDQNNGRNCMLANEIKVETTPQEQGFMDVVETVESRCNDEGQVKTIATGTGEDDEEEENDCDSISLGCLSLDEDEEEDNMGFSLYLHSATDVSIFSDFSFAFDGCKGFDENRTLGDMSFDEAEYDEETLEDGEESEDEISCQSSVWVEDEEEEMVDEGSCETSVCTIMSMD